MQNSPVIGLLPPMAIELEEAVLGAALLSDTDCEICMELLSSDSFYKQENRLIFESIVRIKESGKSPDILVVVHDLKKNKTLQAIGGPGYIARLTNRVASGSNLEDHCLILKEKQIARQYIMLGGLLAQRGYDPTCDIFEINDFAATEVEKIMNVSVLKKQISNTDLAREMMATMESASKHQGVTGLESGFVDLDSFTGGRKKGNLIIVGARPGMGKTALALAYFLNPVIRFKKRMIFFSLEMTAQELFYRLCAIHMNLPLEQLQKGNLNDGEWRYYHQNLEPLLSSNLIIVDDCYTMQEIRSRIKKEKIKGSIDGVILDYLQLVEGKGQSRENELSKISRQCKMTAKNNECPFIALSQVSREVDKRADKRPQISDLRESGAIEQDADVIEFLFRPSYYGDDSHSSEAAFVCIAKNRNGGLKDIPLKFIHNLTKFTDDGQTTMPF